MRIDRLFDILLTSHAFLPYKTGSGYALPMLKVSLELTYQCNLKCIFCFQTEQKGIKERNELSAEEFIQLISRIPRFSLITFTGGEPLLKKNALEVIKYALERHGCNIITNGVMMTEEYTRTFVDKRLLLAGVSIDGIGQDHDHLRGMKGAFDKITHNLKLLQEYKKRKKTKYPLLDVKTVITQENIDMLEDIYQYALDVNADFFTLSPLKVTNIQFQANFINDMKDNKLWSPITVKPYVDPKMLIRKLSHIIESSRNKKIKIRFYPIAQKAEGMETHFDNTKRLVDRYEPCLVPWSSMQISPMGDAYPCIAYKVGNVKEASLMSIWNSISYREFRKQLSAVGLFPGCAGCCYLRERSHTAFNARNYKKTKVESTDELVLK
ncbi:MAG: hypothetical protein HW406_1179 [Candidatus Brocadiaceae bacterium]|nr:hypothetical protein [Candidatus Brocadiaceae bacterium]